MHVIRSVFHTMCTRVNAKMKTEFKMTTKAGIFVVVNVIVKFHSRVLSRYFIVRFIVVHEQ